MSTEPILIAGAGIAGLTCALCLARLGHESIIIESFDEPQEVGAGIQVPPNAWYVLGQLGLTDALLEQAVLPDSICLADAHTGKTILEMVVNRDDRSGMHFATIHRAKLHQILWRAARENSHISIVTSCKVQNVEERDDGVKVSCEANDGSKSFNGSILIGADGIWSNVRRFVPSSEIPHPTGRIALRAMVPALKSEHLPRVTAWMAPKSHIISYPVRNTDTQNIVAIINGAAHSASWSENMDGALPADLTNTLAYITAKRPQDIAFNRWPLYAVKPDGVWHSGRICLIGDAAHGMEPFAAQGAAMGIEDGFELAWQLRKDHIDDPMHAFEAFYKKRVERVSRVAKRTEFNRFAYHQRGIGRLARNMAFASRPAHKFLNDLDWLYGYRAVGF